MTGVRGRWVMMDGLAGAGKSTLAAGLVRLLRERGISADRFGEEELFTRTEFAAVAEGFRTKQWPTPAMFQTAYTTYLAGLEADWAVFDWSAAGMSGDLDWALTDRAAYLRHLRAVTRIDPSRPLILLYLRADLRITVERATAERGRSWIRRYDELAIGAGHTGPDPLARISARAEHLLTPNKTERDAALQAGWTVMELDANQPPGQVLAEATAALARQ